MRLSPILNAPIISRERETMRLSDCPSDLKLKVIRDGVFECLGFVTHDSTSRLVFLGESRYVEALRDDAGITCVLTTPVLAREIPEELGVAVVELPRRAFYALHNHLARETSFYGGASPNVIASSARIHPAAFVAEQNVRIGERVLIEPHATILENVTLEDEVVVRAGAVVGSEGFQFEVDEGRVVPVAHAGGVRLGQRVEIQTGTCVDRSVFGGQTEVGRDTKTDNMVHIAHNVKIGRRCRIAAMAMIAGSVFIGNDVWIGPNATLADNIRVGDRASISLGAVVTRDVAPDQRVTGHFAVEHSKFLNFLRSIR
jgi:UDP-3-O-[3-hydroxymyristoyl] glucosamine N-acyltransferase